jgi:hypothetical protein
MRKLSNGISHGIGTSKSSNSLFSKNHFASATALPAEVASKIASMGLNRVAGNTYICPSTQDFWQVKGNKIMKLVQDEVDNGDHIAAAPADSPMDFLDDVLSDLTF